MGQEIFWSEFVFGSKSKSLREVQRVGVLVLFVLVLLVTRVKQSQLQVVRLKTEV